MVDNTVTHILEKLFESGVESLSVSELIGIVIAEGDDGAALGDKLLSQLGNLRGLLHSSREELEDVPGMNSARAAQIKAAIELGRRLVAAIPDERAKIRSPRDVYNLLDPMLHDEKREHFMVILLDARNGVLRTRAVSIGDLTSTVVHPREVFVDAIRHSAAHMILAHNHTSGDPTPSTEDIAVTERMAHAGELLGIEVLDHIILGDGRWVSLKEQGLF